MGIIEINQRKNPHIKYALSSGKDVCLQAKTKKECLVKIVHGAFSFVLTGACFCGIIAVQNQLQTQLNGGFIYEPFE